MKKLVLFVYIVLSGFVSVHAESPFEFKESGEKSLVLTESEKPVWSYQFGLITKSELPENEKRRTRGCYIHPLYGLNGEILTDDFPKDHYHHHGVFWTWPHVAVHKPDGTTDNYSVWEDIGGMQQRFVSWTDRETRPNSAVLAVENGWFVGNEKIMIEKVRIVTHKRVDEPEIGGTRAIDLEFCWIPTTNPITLRGAEDKSYGGLTVRFRPASDNPSDGITSITVPDGIAKDDLPEKPLPWADFTSKFGSDDKRSGAAIFVPPTHPDFPPTWLTRYYGPLCVGWPGVKGKTFQANEAIRLNYRIWIHENPVTTQQINKAYSELN